MTKLIDQALAEVRKLSDAAQDRVASVLLGLISFVADAAGLTPEQVQKWSAPDRRRARVCLQTRGK